MRGFGDILLYKCPIHRRPLYVCPDTPAVYVRGCDGAEGSGELEECVTRKNGKKIRVSAGRRQVLQGRGVQLDNEVVGG